MLMQTAATMLLHCFVLAMEASKKRRLIEFLFIFSIAYDQDSDVHDSVALV